jgi:hypothetical protein
VKCFSVLLQLHYKQTVTAIFALRRACCGVFCEARTEYKKLASNCTVSYRPVLSSERAPYRKNNKAIGTRQRIRVKSYHGPQRGALFQN